ncbi:MAG: FliH/SctL family protein [Thermosulfidibacteraceae bacterium]
MKRDKIIKNGEKIEEFIFESFEDIEIVYVDDIEGANGRAIFDSVEGYGNSIEVTLITEQSNSEEIKSRDVDIDKVYDESFKKGYKDGYNKGYEEGKAYGLSEIKTHYDTIYSKELENFKNNLNKLFRNLEESFNKWLEDLYSCEDLLVSLVIDAVKLITLQMPREDVIRELVRGAISRIGENAKVVIKVNPSVIVYLEDLNIPSSVSIVPDETLDSASVVVEGHSGVLESKLEDRLKGLIEAVLEYFSGK